MNQILHGQHRGNDFVGSPEMIEFPSRKGQDSHTELIDFGVAKRWLLAQTTAELPI